MKASSLRRAVLAGKVGAIGQDPREVVGKEVRAYRR
jgi:hypothetical protein